VNVVIPSEVKLAEISASAPIIPDHGNELSPCQAVASETAPQHLPKRQHSERIMADDLRPDISGAH
jgi:hypothetical protein